MAEGPPVQPVVIQVRRGEVDGTGSWVYAWLAAPKGGVVYVGATRLPPRVRTWMHLHDPDPNIGRVVARYPAAAIEAMDVLAFSLPPNTVRSNLKAAFITALSAAGLLSSRYIGDPPDAPGAESQIGPLQDLIAAMVEQVAAHRPIAD